MNFLVKLNLYKLRQLSYITQKPEISEASLEKLNSSLQKEKEYTQKNKIDIDPREILWDLYLFLEKCLVKKMNAEKKSIRECIRSKKIASLELEELLTSITEIHL